MKSQLRSERRNQSSQRSSSERRNRASVPRNVGDEGCEEIPPSGRRGPRSHPRVSATTLQEDPALSKTRDFSLAHAVSTAPALQSHSQAQPQARADLGMFSARPPDEEESHTSSSQEAEDAAPESPPAATPSATMPSRPIGAFAIHGHSVQPRTIGRAAPSVGQESLFSAPYSDVAALQQQQPVVAIAAEVRDSQIQGEALRTLAEEGDDPEIRDQIDAHVRRILAENAVPAETIIAVGDSETPLPNESNVEQKEEPLTCQQKLRRNKWVLLALVVLLVVVIIVAVAVPLALSEDGSGDKFQTEPPDGGSIVDSTVSPAPTPAPIPAPTPAPTVPPPPTPAPTPVPTWLQLGKDIEGIDARGILGHSVSLSRDGTIVAAGAPQSGINGPLSGYALVHQYNSSVSAWEQLGQVIGGEGPNEFSGWSVALSDKGDILAVSADEKNQIRVYQYDTTLSAWTQLGQKLNGAADGDRFGSSLAFSGDGTMLAAGAIGATPGYIRVYQYDASTSSWTQYGADIVAPSEAGDGVTGYSLSLSTSGSLLAVGADEMPINGTGVVQVYDYDAPSATWIPFGDELRGLAIRDRFGFSVSLHGSKLAIGAISDLNVASGYVHIYEYISSGWQQIGNALTGNIGDQFGYSLSLSGDALAVGARASSNKNGQIAGKTLVYEYKAASSSWEQVGQPILGVESTDESGISVSLSDDAGVVAIGARFHDGVNGENSGHVRVYNLKELRRLL